MVQAVKKSGPGKVKSAGAVKKTIGKMKRGARAIKPKKAALAKAANFQLKFDKEKRVDIEQEMAAKTASSHSFSVIKPDMSKVEDKDKKNKKKKSKA